jgi:hypothetical protein
MFSGQDSTNELSKEVKMMLQTEIQRVNSVYASLKKHKLTLTLLNAE